MFDALEKAWLGERRSERLAGWFGSVAIHAVVLGWALWPHASASPAPMVRRHVVLPPYEYPADERRLVLRVLPTPGVAISGLPTLDPIPDLQVVPNVYAAPTGMSFLQAMALSRGAPLPPGPIIESVLDEPPEVLMTPP